MTEVYLKMPLSASKGKVSLWGLFVFLEQMKKLKGGEK